ncbi:MULTISPECIES: hypothetical protein [Streptomyces]|uniref:hypothetical protein n=1 Tax=Streptomyces TaxID=1883 RepID=UPI001180042C|nr:hypothetical protein [Streptomyces viridochromogenes]
MVSTAAGGLYLSLATASDVGGWHRRAVGADGRTVIPPEDTQWSSRRARIPDPEDHEWSAAYELGQGW